MNKLGRHPMFLWDPASDAALAAARKLVQEADGAGGGSGNGTVTIAGKSYTQEEASRMFADRAEQAARAERKKVLDELGGTDVEAIKGKLKAAADAEAAGLTELQKAQKERDDAKAAAESADAARKEALAGATLLLQKAAVTVAAGEANCDPTEVETLWREVLATPALLAELKPKDGKPDEFEGVKDVVAKVLKAHPRWLKATTGKTNLNAGERGKNDGEINMDAIIEKKRASGQYSGL